MFSNLDNCKLRDVVLENPSSFFGHFIIGDLISISSPASKIKFIQRFEGLNPWAGVKKTTLFRPFTFFETQKSHRHLIHFPVIVKLSKRQFKCFEKLDMLCRYYFKIGLYSKLYAFYVIMLKFKTRVLYHGYPIYVNLTQN